MTREFIMTPEFDRLWIKMGLDDDELKKLQEEILINPHRGAVIQGTGGLRKMRFALGAGKSGGARVLYVDFAEFEMVYLISAYPKNEKVDLTAAERSNIRKVIMLLKKYERERRAGG